MRTDCPQGVAAAPISDTERPGARTADMAPRAWGRDRVVAVVTAQCRCVSVALVNPLRRRGAMLGERP
jgi:hypothetical protein